MVGLKHKTEQTHLAESKKLEDEALKLKEKVVSLDEDLAVKQEEAKTLENNYEELENQQIALWNHCMTDDKVPAKMGKLTRQSEVELGSSSIFVLMV